MGDHDDELVFRDLFDEVHDLNRSLAIKGAGWLIGEKDVWLIDESTRDGDSLALATRKLVWFLGVHVLEADFVESGFGSGDAFLFLDAADR